MITVVGLSAVVLIAIASKAAWYRSEQADAAQSAPGPMELTIVTPDAAGGAYAMDENGSLWRLTKTTRQPVRALQGNVLEVTPVTDGGAYVSTFAGGLFYVRDNHATPVRRGDLQDVKPLAPLFRQPPPPAGPVQYQPDPRR